jgi:hypothetical protein
MTITRKKRPRDPVQLGKLIVDIATGQVEDREDNGKDWRPRRMGGEAGGGEACGDSSQGGSEAVGSRRATCGSVPNLLSYS